MKKVARPIVLAPMKEGVFGRVFDGGNASQKEASKLLFANTGG